MTSKMSIKDIWLNPFKICLFSTFIKNSVNWRILFQKRGLSSVKSGWTWYFPVKTRFTYFTHEAFLKFLTSGVFVSFSSDLSIVLFFGFSGSVLAFRWLLAYPLVPAFLLPSLDLDYGLSYPILSYLVYLCRIYSSARSGFRQSSQFFVVPLCTYFQTFLLLIKFIISYY